jgi:hypothetical protein
VDIEIRSSITNILNLFSSLLEEAKSTIPSSFDYDITGVNVAVMVKPSLNKHGNSINEIIASIQGNHNAIFSFYAYYLKYLKPVLANNNDKSFKFATKQMLEDHLFKVGTSIDNMIKKNSILEKADLKEAEFLSSKKVNLKKYLTELKTKVLPEIKQEINSIMD